MSGFQGFYCIISLINNYFSEFREAFNLFDKNKDNVISAKELGTVMRALGQSPTDKDIELMIQHADVNSEYLVDLFVHLG